MTPGFQPCTKKCEINEENFVRLSSLCTDCQHCPGWWPRRERHFVFCQRAYYLFLLNCILLSLTSEDTTRTSASKLLYCLTCKNNLRRTCYFGKHNYFVIKNKCNYRQSWLHPGIFHFSLGFFFFELNYFFPCSTYLGWFEESFIA